MARPRQIQDGELLNAAREAFVDSGPATTVSQIAQRLGVSAAALFQRVGSKAQLMMLALAPNAPPVFEALAEGPHADAMASAQLRDHLLELQAFFKSLVPNLIILRAAGLFPPPREKGAAGATPRPPTALELRRRMGCWLETAVAQGRLHMQDPHVCAEALLGAMEARCFNAHVGGPSFVKGTDEDFVVSMIAGLITDLEAKPAGRGRKSTARKRST